MDRGWWKMDTKVITICCSMSKVNEETILDVSRKLSRDGWIVLLPTLLKKSERENLSLEEKEKLIKLHKTRIAISDMIYVLNLDNYIGEGVREEIGYARLKDKYVMYHEERDFNIKSESKSVTKNMALAKLKKGPTIKEPITDNEMTKIYEARGILTVNKKYCHYDCPYFHTASVKCSLEGRSDDLKRSEKVNSNYKTSLNPDGLLPYRTNFCKFITPYKPTAPL